MLTPMPGSVLTRPTGPSNIAMLGMHEKLGCTQQAPYNYCRDKLFAPQASAMVSSNPTLLARPSVACAACCGQWTGCVSASP